MLEADRNIAAIDQQPVTSLRSATKVELNDEKAIVFYLPDTRCWRSSSESPFASAKPVMVHEQSSGETEGD